MNKPPYDVVFTRYAKEDFGWDDQVRLADYLAAHRGPVVLRTRRPIESSSCTSGAASR